MWLYVAALAMVNPNPKGAFLNCCNARGVRTPTVLLGRDFQLLRETRDEIAGPRTEIFVSSLDTGEVPEDWQIANVVPLFKKGSKDNLGNYRPVSLMSVAGKLLGEDS